MISLKYFLPQCCLFQSMKGFIAKWSLGRDYLQSQNSVLPVSILVTKYRFTFLKNDKFGQKITENADNVKFVTKKRQLQ